MILLVTTLCVVIAILYSLLKSVLEKVQQGRDLQGIPCEKRLWLSGNVKRYPPNELGLSREIEMMNKHPRCVQRWYGPWVCSIMCYHPDNCKTLLKTYERKGAFVYNILRPWIGDGLLLSHGRKWQRNRRLLTPIFHFESLKRYLPCTNDAAIKMLNTWISQNAQPRRIETFHEFSLMTLDNLLRCMFSIDSGCETGENRKYLNAVKFLAEAIPQRMRNVFYQYDFIYFQTKSGKKYKESLKVAHTFTENAIQERLECMQKCGVVKETSQYDFLDVLLMAKDERGIGLSIKEIRDELDTFVFEGHDTVTSALSWAFYNLALYPTHQELCRDEVIRVLCGKSRVEWEHLPKFDYLTKFIKECMRLYPPVVEIFRETRGKPAFTDVPMPDVEDKMSSEDANSTRGSSSANCTLGLRIFLLHRNPAVWENPDVFDPERFDPENICKRPTHAYLPFSAGSRNCIGQNFAMNEIKVVLAVALTRFRFTVDNSFPKPERKIAGNLRSESGIHLTVYKI